LKGGFAALQIWRVVIPIRTPQMTSHEVIMADIVIANRTTPDGREKTLKGGFLSSMSPGLNFL
jgi:hypothetical protein